MTLPFWRVSTRSGSQWRRVCNAPSGALLARLKANAGLTALVPAASINPDGEPTWPHIRRARP